MLSDVCPLEILEVLPMDEDTSGHPWLIPNDLSPQQIPKHATDSTPPWLPDFQG
jgi:hypothetical protein